MAISLKNTGSYINLVNTFSIAIPGSPADGDRMFLFVTSKDYTQTLADPSGWTAIGSGYADGTDGGGAGSGSMWIHAWYRDWVSGDGAVSVSIGSDGGTAIIQLWTKGSGDVWDAPLAANAAWPSSVSQTVSASASVAVPDGSVVFGFIGFPDDRTSVTRPTDAIDVASGITWDGNYVESPAAHYYSSSAQTAAADLGHRFVTTGGTVTLRLSATIDIAETGAVKFVVQGLVVSNDLTILHGWKAPRTAETLLNGDVSWSTPSNALAVDSDVFDSAFASATIPVSGSTDVLKLTDLGLNVPTDATIIGIELAVWRYASDYGFVFDETVRLYKAGVIVGDNKADAGTWPAAENGFHYGGPTDLWGTTWTGAELNASGFGVGVQALNNSGAVVPVAYFGFATIRVHYTVAGLYGVAWDQTDNIEIVRPLAALNAVHVSMDPAKIDEEIYWPKSAGGDELAISGTAVAQWSLGLPLYYQSVYRAKLWTCIRVGSGSLQLVGGRIRLDGVWYEAFKSPYGAVSTTDQQWWCLEFVDIPNVAAVGSAPAFELSTRFPSGSGFLDAVYLEMFGSGQELAFDAPGESWTVAAGSYLQTPGGTTFLAARSRWVVSSPGAVALNEHTFTAPGAVWGVGADVSQSVKAAVSPRLRWRFGTLRFESAFIYVAAGLEWRFGGSSLTQDHEHTFSAPAAVWGVGADVVQTLSFDAPEESWGVGNSSLAFLQAVSFLSPSLEWRSPGEVPGGGSVPMLVAAGAPASVTFTSPSESWFVGSSVLDATIVFSAPGEVWGVGSGLLSAIAELSVEAPAEVWSIDEHSLEGIAETTFSAPGLGWSVALTLDAENNLAVTASGILWTFGAVVLEAEGELSVVAPGEVWSVAPVSFSAVSELSVEAPAEVWSVSLTLDAVSELVVDSPAEVWGVGSVVLSAIAELSGEAPVEVWSVGEHSLEGIAETTFSAPALGWWPAGSLEGSNVLAGSAPAEAWSVGSVALVSVAELLVSAPAERWRVGLGVWSAVGSLNVSAPVSVWNVSGVAIVGAQIGGPWSIRKHILLGTTKAPAVLVGNFLDESGD